MLPSWIQLLDLRALPGVFSNSNSPCVWLALGRPLGIFTHLHVFWCLTCLKRKSARLLASSKPDPGFDFHIMD